ncbi:MAG: hypothetical protein M1838_003502 [Thelocarpon superellum]|nr:MAG: hypothetical protein M1838_003502 [Thelocarpon superellum]
MSSHRYERVSGHEEGDSPTSPQNEVPNSPPPSFRSRASSPASRHVLSHDPLTAEADQALADSFDVPSDEDGLESSDEGDGDDRERLMHRMTTGTAEPATTPMDDTRAGQDGGRPNALPRRNTLFPSVADAAPATPSGRVYGGGSASVNDGVFANLDAKPERGEKTEEQPPSYEQAAADATPPYWETTILAPGVGPDEVFIDGLPVGSAFSFVWNGMISMSFQLVGFLLTYLLHTTHAAKNGSKAGLGITLVQYGFYMKSAKGRAGTPSADPAYAQPQDPNSHDFDTSSISNAAVAVAAMADASDGNTSASSRGAMASITSSDWLAYLLMIVGWFILIRAVSNFLKARRHEQLVLQSPDRGLSVPIVAEGEGAETVV